MLYAKSNQNVVAIEYHIKYQLHYFLCQTYKSFLLNNSREIKFSNLMPQSATNKPILKLIATRNKKLKKSAMDFYP